MQSRKRGTLQNVEESKEMSSNKLSKRSGAASTWTSRQNVLALALFTLVLAWRWWLLHSHSLGTLDVKISKESSRDYRGIISVEGEPETTIVAKVDNSWANKDYENENENENDGYDVEGEEALTTSKRTSILLTKGMIHKTLEREKTTRAFLEAQKESIPEPGKGPKLVKNKEVEKHFTKGHWFVPGEKYFVYQPSGGMSNQRIILEHAVLIARVLGRTLVVPPLGPHTSMFWNYNKVEWDRTVEAFHVFERDRLQTAVPVLGLSNCILRRFVEANENKFGQKWLRVQRERKGLARGVTWTLKDIQSMFGNVTEDVLFFAQSTMWKSFEFSEEESEYAQKHVQLDSEFRRIAREAVDYLFPDGEPFNAVHIRFEDKYTQILTDKLSPASTFIRRLNKKGVLAVSKRLFVATQPSKITSPYFDAFREAGFELFFSENVLQHAPVSKFLERFPNNDIRSSVLGLMEQLICSRANYFLGTGFSTFSRYIRIKRNERVLMYDQTLLAPRYLSDPSFLAHCTTEQASQAMQDSIASSPSPNTLQRELALLRLEPTCENLAVSLRIC